MPSHPPTRKYLLQQLEEYWDNEYCVIAISNNPRIDPSSSPNVLLSHIRDVSNILSLVIKGNCEKVALLYNTTGSTLYFADYLLKQMRGIGVTELKVIVLDFALNLGVLTLLGADNIELTPWSLIGSAVPYIHSSPISTKDAMIVKELVDQIMVSIPKEGVSGKAQILHALSVSGMYYEYELSRRSVNYVEKLIVDLLEGRIPEEKINEILDRLLLKVELREQVMSAKEFKDLVPFAEIVSGELLDALKSYRYMLSDLFENENTLVLVESSSRSYTVSLSQGSMPFKLF
ncbi:hypothetical protein EYM_07765 [Ignicoccus islandicus DSM 13165]|uniref:Uncharacterized protein n=2 Tax=Ignicoccus islandicus TaxID=54259 RepID=A0A0U3FR45_9CREN|nr:hypothetical protein EYM_07765 [Ignicoccus islandicus DSM 13165]